MKKFFTTLFACLFLLPMTLLAGEWPVHFEWDPYTDPKANYFELHEAPASGGPWSDSTIVVDNIQPTSLTDVIYTSTKPDGVATTSYFILKAVNSDNGQKSGPSEEVNFVYDFAPIVEATNFAVALNGDDVTFEWEQADINRVAKWLLYMSETSGTDYNQLAEIIYTGQPGPQYSTTETMTVPPGEEKTFYFVLVTFNKFDVFSQNSLEVSVTIDKTQPAPVFNFRLKVVVQ